METQARVAVVLATHNGALTLPTTLESFTRLEEPAGGWSLIVVDNASTDATSRVLDSFKHRLPLTVLYQAKRGMNSARNTPLFLLSSDLVVFTDDDVIAAPDWLRRLKEAADANPGFHIFGGAIVPHWLGRPEPWLLEECAQGAMFAITPAEWKDGPISPNSVWGGNMAVRGSVFESGLRFDEEFGPAPGNYTMGGESEFNRRAERAGFRCWHVNAAVVEHIIRPHQVEPRWVIARAFRLGLQAGIVEWNECQQSGWRDMPRLFGLPRWRLRNVIELSIRAAVCRMAGQSRLWFRYAYAASYQRGVLAKMRSIYALEQAVPRC